MPIVKFEVSETEFFLEVGDSDLTEDRLNEIGCEYVANNIAGIPVSIDGELIDDLEDQE